MCISEAPLRICQWVCFVIFVVKTTPNCYLCLSSVQIRIEFCILLTFPSHLCLKSGTVRTFSQPMLALSIHHLDNPYRRNNIRAKHASNTPKTSGRYERDPLTFFPSMVSGTSPDAILCASPSAMAVFPTPGSPMRHGLFLVRRPKI